jgi:DNA repair protein RadA/Sms
MVKNKILFICDSCGAEYSKWSGKCAQCDSWNTIRQIETKALSKKDVRTPVSVQLLSDVVDTDTRRVLTPVGEFNIVCGGGIVPGSVVLIGGEPGIGKSTLSLMIAGSMKTLYISGEESPAQIKQRADRIGIQTSNVAVSTDTEVHSIITIIRGKKPDAVFIDSIQTITAEEIPAPAGSLTQVRESASRLADVAKEMNIPLFLIGHITKDGSIAGPKILEHIVDTVLYFEGDFTKEYRILRAFKNRYGSVNEIGLFKMTAKGLEEITDRNSLFLNPSSIISSGSAVSAAIEGSRTVLFEVQSLATFSSFANPRRMSDGLDLNRLILLAAVLEKHTGIKCSNHDVFLNIAGGLTIHETSADLAIALSIASSIREKPLPGKTAFLGEISLSGEVRPVSQPERRILELTRSGFSHIVLSKKDAEECRAHSIKGDFTGVITLSEAVTLIL